MKLIHNKYVRLVSTLCLVISIVLATAFFTGVGDPKADFTTMREFMESIYPKMIQVGFGAERMIYRYDDDTLWNNAHTIALVTPMDELTVENSHIINKWGTPRAFFSRRQVRVIEFFKNEEDYENEFMMAELCVLLEDGTLVYKETCYPMQKGDYYLVFLAKSGYLSSPAVPLGYGEGKYDITNLHLNDRLSDATKAFEDLLHSTMPEDIGA